jgi:hypothetical protein
MDNRGRGMCTENGKTELSLVVSVSKDDYGSDYNDHCIEQYKLFCQITEALASRRLVTNRLFLAIATALLALPNILKAISEPAKDNNIWVIPVFGIVFSFLWYRILLSYSTVATARYEIINAMEKKLPFKCYAAEWNKIKLSQHGKCYKAFSKIESWIPRCFLGFFILLFIMSNWEDIFKLAKSLL